MFHKRMSYQMIKRSCGPVGEAQGLSLSLFVKMTIVTHCKAKHKTMDVMLHERIVKRLDCQFIQSFKLNLINFVCFTIY